jgi:hypothetical protein
MCSIAVTSFYGLHECIQFLQCVSVCRGHDLECEYLAVYYTLELEEEKH